MVRSHWKLVSLKILIPYPDASKRIRIGGTVAAVLNLLMVFMLSKTALKYRVEGLFSGRTKVRSFFPQTPMPIGGESKHWPPLS